VSINSPFLDLPPPPSPLLPFLRLYSLLERSFFLLRRDDKVEGDAFVVAFVVSRLKLVLDADARDNDDDDDDDDDDGDDPPTSPL